jgi:hypothetical protein
MVNENFPAGAKSELFAGLSRLELPRGRPVLPGIFG